MLTVEQFTEQLLAVSNEYRRDNLWVNDWAHWNNPVKMAEYIHFAYKLYAATANNRLKLTLLGGTEIRLNAPLIQNFGVTGVNGIQDKKTREIVVDTVWKRLGLLKNHPRDATKPDKSYANVTRTGSILSEKGWTPILNDALIIGAITAGQGFAMALTPIEQADWNEINIAHQQGKKVKQQPFMATGAGARSKFLTDKFESKSPSKEVWKKFFNSQRRMFFNCQTRSPRVFTRELLGLYFFGYKPEFTPVQLGFSAGSKKRMTDFKTYLRNLRSLGFHKGVANEKKIMEAISMFLFDDKTAIGSPWPVDTKVLEDTYSEFYH